MVFRNISKINGADTLTPSEITLKAPPENRLFEAFREWSMDKIVCGYETERLLGPKRECFPPLPVLLGLTPIFQQVSLQFLLGKEDQGPRTMDFSLGT